jgi:glutamyl-tRNA reductase
MHTVLVGLNYKTTQIDNREKIYFSADRLDEALTSLVSYPAIRECVILSTCNRVEIYAVANNTDLAFQSIIQFISDFHGISQYVFLSFIYKKKCDEAVNHLFRVISSLDSMIVGEYEILGQVKTAYEKASNMKCTKEILNRIFQMAFEVGKRVRTETAIGKGAISVGSVATGLIKDIFPGEAKLNVMLIGAGVVAELTAKNLVAKINCNITITNRSSEKAEEFARIFNAECVEYDTKYEHYANQDVLVFSTSSQTFILKDEDVGFLQPGNGRRIALIDLSIPRNIDPMLSRREGIFLNTIDDLTSVVDTSVDERLKEMEKAEIIIKEQEVKFVEWYNMMAVIPVMRQIKQKFVSMQSRLMDTYSSDLSNLNDYQKDIVKKMMDNYSDAIIKTIMLNLKEVTDPATLHHLGDALKKTFKIHENENIHA